MSVGEVDTPNFEFDFGGQNQSFDLEEEPEFDFNNSQLDSDITFDFGEDGRQNSDPLPTPAKTNKRATEYISEGRQYLIEAMELYAGFGGARIDMTAVTPETESFSQYRIKSKIRNAKQPLQQAANHATEGQQVYILALEQVGIFLKHTTEAEAALQIALSEYRASMEYLYDGDTTNFETPQRRMDKEASNAKSEVGLIKSETDISSMQVIDSDAYNLYEAKLSQFESLIQAFNDLEEAISDLSDGLEEVKNGVENYLNRKYGDASYRFSPAVSDFDRGKSRFSGIQDDGVLKSTTKPGWEFAKVLYKIAYDLHQSAEAKTDYNDEKYTEYRDQAITHLRSDDRTRYMSDINKIQW